MRFRTVVIILLVILAGIITYTEFSNRKVTIDIVNRKIEIKEELEEVAKLYEKENPNIDINITSFGGEQDTETELAKLIESGNEPDIMMLNGLKETYKYKEYLLDVTDSYLAKIAYPELLDGARLDDTLYGVPYNIEGTGWMINKDLFERAGIDPDEIHSYSEFEEAVELLDSKKEELGMDAVFGFSGATTWVIEHFATMFLASEFNDDIYVASDAKTINWTEGDEFKKYADLVRKYNLQPINSVTYDMSVVDNFATGKVAIIHQGNWIIPTINEIDPTFAQDKMDMLPYFLGEDGTEETILAGTVWYWGINKQRQTKESMKFLEWLYTSNEGKEQLMDTLKFIPSYSGNNITDIEYPIAQEIYYDQLHHQVTPWIHNSFPLGWAENDLAPAFQQYMAGEISWDKFESKTIDAWELLRSE